MTKILVALYEQAEQAQQTARQLATLGIAQREISVLSSQGGSSSAGLLGDAQSGAQLVRKLAEFGIPQDQAELYAQGLEHGLSFVLARVENDRAEQAGQVMERQPIVDIEARPRSGLARVRGRKSSRGCRRSRRSCTSASARPAVDGFACIRASRSGRSRSASACMRRKCTSSAGKSAGR